MKLEGWTSEYIYNKVQAFIESLPHKSEYIYQVNRGDYKKGMLKQAKVDSTLHKMTLLSAGAELFRRYTEKLSEVRRYDYEDMILWVIEAFEKHPYLLRSYQEKYLYFLVDEFQDTNGAQQEVLNKLISYWGKPNIFVVGDDDQSIFEFQGARLKNFSDFYHNYRDHLKVISLRENYRSTQTILDSSYELIENNRKRIINSLGDLEIQKKLHALHKIYGKINILPAVWSFENRFEEEVALVEEVQRLQEDGYPLEEVAIVYARHKEGRNIIELLEKKGIPYYVKKKINILDLPIFRQIKQILEYTTLELDFAGRGDHHLYQILHFPFLRVNRNDIEKVAWYFLHEQQEHAYRWKQAIRDEVLLSQAGVLHPSSFLEVARLLDDIMSWSKSLPLTLFIEKLINRSGLLNYVLDHPDKIWFIQVLRSFVDFVKNETSQAPRMSIKDLLEIFGQLDENRLPLEITKVTKAKNGVNLLTAHSTKGLEFGTVFIVDAVKDYWEPRNRASAFQFLLPDTLTYSGEEDATEARRRLFYVAMTRAKERLVISYSKRNHSGKPLERAIFVDELTSAAQLPEIEKSLLEYQSNEAQLLYLKERPAPKIITSRTDWIRERLKSFKMSVSSLSQFLACPLGFYYRYVLNVPLLSTEAANYGMAVHNALYRLFSQMMNNKDKAFPSEGAFLHFFEREMEVHRTGFSFKGWDQALKRGLHNLSLFYQQKRGQWNKSVKVELVIGEAELAGIPLIGIIDKIELLPQGKVLIVDYKTGSHSSSKLRPPGKSNPFGGIYWRQLIFYKILYEQYTRGSKNVEAGKIVYLEPTSQGAFVEKTVSFDTEAVRFTKELIRNSYQRIMALDFFEGCGEKDCPWCSFVLDNEISKHLSQPILEELDDKMGIF